MNLRSLVSALQDIVLGVVADIVLLSAAAGGGVPVAGGTFVSLTAFKTEKASSVYHRSILDQPVEEGGIELGGITFTVLEDSQSFVWISLPPGEEVYLCFVGLMVAI